MFYVNLVHLISLIEPSSYYNLLWNSKCRIDAMAPRIRTLLNASVAVILLVAAVIQTVALNQLQPSILVSHWLSKRDQCGNVVCSNNTPSVTTVAGSRMQCQRRCSYAFSCWNFNYFDNDNSCELFNYKPVNFTQIPNCHYFEVSRSFNSQHFIIMLSTNELLLLMMLESWYIIM